MYEYEGEFEEETELEGEYEGEFEGEEFLNIIRRLAGRAAAFGRRQAAPGSPLRRVAFGTARQVGRSGLPALGRWGGGVLGGEAGGGLGGPGGAGGVPGCGG